MRSFLRLTTTYTLADYSRHSVILLSGILASFYLVERAGRRNLINYGGLIMVASLVVIGGLGFADITSATSNATIFFM